MEKELTLEDFLELVKRKNLKKLENDRKFKKLKTTDLTKFVGESVWSEGPRGKIPGIIVSIHIDDKGVAFKLFTIRNGKLSKGQKTRRAHQLKFRKIETKSKEILQKKLKEVTEQLDSFMQQIVDSDVSVIAETDDQTVSD